MAEIKLSDLPWGGLNNIQDNSDGLSGDRRRTNTTTALRLSVEAAYSRDTLNNINEFNGVIVSYRPVAYASYKNRTAMFENYVYSENPDGEEEQKPKDYATFAYKVYIPELECRPVPQHFQDPVLVTYPDVYSDIEGTANLPLELGTLVAVKYEDVDNLFNPRITRKVGGPIQIQNIASAELNKAFRTGIPKALGGSSTMGPPVPAEFLAAVGSTEVKGEYYPPGPSSTELFVSASALALSRLKGIDSNVYGDLTIEEVKEIAEQPEINYILAKESGGWVGRPNYRYSDIYANIGNPKNRNVWAEASARAKIKDGGHFFTKKEASSPTALKNARIGSTAIGLGQLVYDNVVVYSSVSGYYSNDKETKALAEAVGLLSYVIDRYGDAKTAWSVYSKLGTYYHRFRKIKMKKTSEQGY
jgi:hypothetical protein